MNLEGIIVSEVNQKEKDDTMWSHLYVESKRQRDRENGLVDREWIHGAGGVEMGEGRQKEQTSSYKMSKSWGCHV